MIIPTALESGTAAGVITAPSTPTPTPTEVIPDPDTHEASNTTNDMPVEHIKKTSATKKRKRPRLDIISRNQDILFLIFKCLEGQDEETISTSSSTSAHPIYEFTTIRQPYATATCATVQTMTNNRSHDLTQDALSKMCRVNRAFAKVGLPFLWRRPKIRTCRQLDRFAFTLELYGGQYFDHIWELVVQQGSVPDANYESLWWGHARCRAILFKVATHCSRLTLLDCNWVGSPFDHRMVRALTDTSMTSLKALRLEPAQMPCKEPCLNEEDFMQLISRCVNLESLELDLGYKTTNRSITHLLVTCPRLACFVFPSTCISGWVDALDMGFGENLRSIKIYTPLLLDSAVIARELELDSFSFHPHCLPNLESINLGFGFGDFVEALFTKPLLPTLRSLKILQPSNTVLEILSCRLAPQLTMFETKLNEATNPEVYKVFSSRMASLQSLDCSPGPVMGLIGRNITTLSANSSLRLLDSVAELCPNLEDLTLWGGSVSRDPSSRTRSDPQSGMIYIIEMCPIKRLRLVNAYLGLGPKFWQACGEFGTKLRILDIDLLDHKGMNSWGLFEGLRHCKKLQWLRLTELLNVRKEASVMVSCLKDLRRLCGLHLNIPDMETGYFSMSIDEISALLSSFCELSDVNLVIPKPCPNSATTTPRSSMIPDQRIYCYGLPYAKADPTMVFKNALRQNIYGRVEWSTPQIGYY
ncbi:hypothetical protein BG011_007658 [Mortierella polycephala]|uniref:Uncharacterized protein n=1 Tax=Mortierella polycephala TaxID=41804 RepID=A0A9P6QJW8_9FUNG|nr:hypothetical protein BG011_007658 [Mortierella polycephala]